MSVFKLTISLLFVFSALAHSQMSVPRYDHSATLLPDGNFLVTGGRAALDNAMASAEVYVTSKTAWENAFSLNTARYDHTATLLSDGRVMIAGGYDNAGTALPSIQVYDTESKTLSGEVNMQTARAEHTATLLTKGPYKGNVLICGGQNGAGTMLNSCEIFVTTATGAPYTFYADSMITARKNHTANAFKSGRVFVSGGIGAGGTYLANNEYYDPELDSWFAADPLYIARTFHTATVMNNGNVLIAGGYNPNYHVLEPEKEIYWGMIDTAEIFNEEGGRVPVQGQEYSVMPYRIYGHSSVLMPDGEVHLFGGLGNITTSYFQPNLEAEAGSYIDATKTDIATATIDTTSVLRFLIDTQLSRRITGRAVEGDIFFSLPQDPNQASMQVENASIYLERSTAPVDGAPIGEMIPGYPGELKYISELYQPQGRVRFEPIALTPYGLPAIVNPSWINFSPTPINEGDTADIVAGSSVTLNIDFTVPSIYIGGVLSGTATISNASIVANNEYYTVLITGGEGDFTTGVVTQDPDGNGLANATIIFSNISGEIINTTTTAISSPQDLQGDDTDTLSAEIEFAATLINMSGVSYTVDVSTIQIRKYVSADDLSFVPVKSDWEFNETAMPMLDHTVMATPAADMVIMGGRNCEDDPYNDCVRGTPDYNAKPYSLVYIQINEDKWSGSKEMNYARAFHNSTLMPDGSVLTCGGMDAGETLKSCEIYDKSSDEWVLTSSMNYTRSNFTSTLLPNGNVLAAGGQVNSSTIAVNSAEIYYPDTKRWIETSAMSQSRSNHTAVLLPNGNVLVAGGRTAGGYSDSAEIYITTSSYWVSGGTFTGARAYHTAALLKDGRVLIGGGIGPSGPINTTQIYDPATNSWSAGPPLNTGRWQHTMHLLKDGRIIFIGGSSGIPIKTAEICAIGGSCVYTNASGNDMLTFRAKHSSILLPNGKILVMGGERQGEAINSAEGYDVDFSTWQSQGAMERRVRHTSVLMSDGYIMNIGGYDGQGNYLKTTERIYFSYNIDAQGLPPKDRQPVISTGTATFDKSGRVTLISDTSNFHSITEASSGRGNESFHNPRIYISQIDNQAGFLTDLTTSLYTLFQSPNSDWGKTVSSISLNMPSNPGELPYGYYNFWVANNGVFSEGFTVQVTSARPVGQVALLSAIAVSTDSITWQWNVGSLANSDGYTIFSSSDNVFISTVSLSDPASYNQAGLAPNTPVSIKVGGFNLGGYSYESDLVKSATVYTYANAPSNLTVNNASFETVGLEWSPERNSGETIYELTLAYDAAFTSNVSTPILFNDNYKSTSASVSQLSANQEYFFRVRAMNGDGFTTGFSNVVSTITVGNINNLQGTPLDVSSIRWSWDESEGADFYEMYDVTNGTDSAVFVGSTTVNYLTQTSLSTNTAYTVAVNAAKDTIYGPVSGPRSFSSVYTLAVEPLPGVPNAFTQITTGSFRLNWKANGNPSYTTYLADIAAGMDEETEAEFIANIVSSASTTGTDMNFDDLVPNTSYYAMVMAYNGNGVATGLVSLGKRYTRAQPPSGVTAPEISMSGVTLVWDTGDNPGNTYYEVRASTDNWVTISTIVPFGMQYTEDAVEISGLLTSTTYYFDVAAINGESIITARTQCVPNVYTVDGPENAPAGSIGGTSDPNETVTISGTLPNGREVSLTVPANSFTAENSIAIAASTNNYCNYLVNGQSYEVTIYADNHLPYSPVILQTKYGPNSAEVKQINSNASSLVMALYDPSSGQCRSLKTVIDQGFRTITADLDHFSTFQLVSKTAASDLDNVLVYPNPIRLNRPGNASMKFENLPAGAGIKIYTLSGVEIWKGNATATGLLTWKGRNKYGNMVASGIYLCLVESGTGKKIIKVAVER